MGYSEGKERNRSTAGIGRCGKATASRDSHATFSAQRQKAEPIPDVVMLVNPDWTITYASQSSERVLALRPLELAGTSPFDLLGWRDSSQKASVSRALKAATKKGDAEFKNMCAITKSGRRVPIILAARTIRDDAGNPLNLVIVIRDDSRRNAQGLPRLMEGDFRALVENSLDVSVILNSDLTIRYVSPSLEGMLGYSRDELLGRGSFGFLHHDDAQNVIDHYGELAKSAGQAVHVEVRFRHKNGTWRILEGVANNLVGDPSVNGVVINARDITERKMAEEALREREEYFRALIENSLEGIAILNPDMTIRYESPSAERIVGYAPEEMIGHHALEFIHPDDIRIAVKTLDALTKNRSKPVPTAIRLLHKDGTWHIVEGVAQNLLNDPIVSGVVVNYRDVTERNQAEQLLRQREEHFRALIDHSLDGIAILDRNGTIRYQSPSAERMMGRQPDERLGRNPFEYVHPDDMPNVARAFAELVESHGAVVYKEARVSHADGSWRTVEVVAQNLLDSPAVGAIVVNFRDATERKQSEQARIEHAAALAKAEELELSRQRIITAEESVRRDIAQELHGSVQNRLIVLLHRLSELEREARSPDMATKLTDLRERLADLLESHVRSISHRLYPSILRRGLTAALQSLADRFETALPIEMKLDQDLARAERNEPRLIPEQVRLSAYRIAEEALNNAAKSAAATKATIVLALGSNGWLRLEVADDGQGFDPECASRGLGILMMQDYAEVAGGQCRIRSCPGAGTEIVATLPLSAPHEESSERTSPSV